MPDDSTDSQVLGLPDLVGILRRRWRWLVGSFLVMLVLALGISLQQAKQYSASVRVLVRTVASVDQIEVDPNAQLPYFPDRQLKNEVEVIGSAAVRGEVEKAYAGPSAVDAVKITIPDEGSDVVELSATSADAVDAADLVNTYARVYLEYSQAERDRTITSASTEIQEQADGLAQQIQALSGPIQDLQGRVASSPRDVELGSQLERLVTEQETLDAQRSTYLRQLKSLDLARGLSGVGAAKQLTVAGPPAEPVSPKPLRDGLIGAMFGLGLGLVLAFAREVFDDAIRSAADLERAVKGAHPVLAIIPETDRDAAAGLLVETQPSTKAAEAFRSLRTSVRFAEIDSPLKVIQITSASAAEGKTTTAANLGAMLAEAGHNVAVVCCDLRRPQIHRLFGVPPTPGIADVLLGDCPLATALRDRGNHTFVLPAGTRPPNPSELLGTPRAEHVIAALVAEMDYVIVDSTPILPVTDALVVSRFVDATIVVAAAGRTSRHQMDRALTALKLASAPVIGVVLNRAVEDDTDGYVYGYAYDEPRDRSPKPPANGPGEPRAVIEAGRRG